MMTIELSNLRFHAFHGLFAEEKKIGGTFIVNIKIDYMPRQLPVLDLNDSIDYGSVYMLVKELMKIPEALLETVVSKIAVSIFENFSQAETINISLMKVNPPIIAFEGNVAVRLTQKRTPGV